MKLEKTNFMYRELMSLMAGWDSELKDRNTTLSHIQLSITEIEQLELKAEKLDNAIVELKELIEYGEQQWDGQPINKGMLEGLRESVRILEGKQ